MSKVLERTVEVVPAEKKIAKRNGSQSVATSAPSMEAVLTRAVEQGAPIETMERIVAMIERANAQAAKREYLAALAKFQAVMPPVAKKKRVKDKQGNHRYSYAPIEDIMPIAREFLAANDLSVTTGSDIDFEHDQIVATAYGHHSAGHTESREFRVPIDREAYMSDPQKYGSASTFAERYATRQLLGIVTAGMDDDGAGGKMSPADARAKQAERKPVSQPQARKSAEPTERAKIQPAANKDEAIEASTLKVIRTKMTNATLSDGDFEKRFGFAGIENIKKTDLNPVMGWLANPLNK